MVGVGLGASTQHYPAYGLPPRAASLASAKIGDHERLWTEDKVTLDGRFSHLESIPMEPKPVQRPHPQSGWRTCRGRVLRAVNWETATLARAPHRWTFFWKISNSYPRLSESKADVFGPGRQSISPAGVVRCHLPKARNGRSSRGMGIATADCRPNRPS